MENWGYVVAMGVTGAVIACQAPINAGLGRHVGSLEAALLSFTVGTTALVLIVGLAGKGSFRALQQVPWWQYLGGLCGVVYLTTSLFAVSKIGATSILAAAVAGQMIMAIVLDRFGWLGLPVRTLDWPRVAGSVMLVASVWLITSRR
jgi:transporter family-2 protein